MIFNLLLYMGIFFIVAGFSLFLYSEMRLREIDIQLFKLEQRIKKELKAVRLIKLEEDLIYCLMSFATIDVTMIGLVNMEQWQLIILAD